MGKPSRIGFGHNPFGHPHGGALFSVPGGGPYPFNVGFGRGDWAEEVTWRILPDDMRDEDGLGSDVPEPLRGILEAVKPLLNELLAKWVIFPSLWDAVTCPIDQLPMLAYNVGITLDPAKNERLQRSEVLNAAQLFLHKGTDLGYTILAAFEDLLVEIIPLWAESADPSAALTPVDPTVFVPYFNSEVTDSVPLDAEYNDRFALWPKYLGIKDEKRSHFLRLIFYPTANPSQDFDADVASRLAERLLRFKPIYVEIDRIVFDGLRGSSQTWVQDIDAGNYAAGMWMDGPIVSLLTAASQTWIGTVVADTV